jgi:hypothetical protein
MKRPDQGDVFLSLGQGMEDFCHEHMDQQITVEGQLFHAHTTHHYTPVLIDVKRILE